MWWQLITDVSAKPIGPIVKGQEIKERKSVKNYHHTPSNIIEERRFYLLRDGNLKLRMDSFSFSLRNLKEEMVEFLGLILVINQLDAQNLVL